MRFSFTEKIYPVHHCFAFLSRDAPLFAEIFIEIPQTLNFFRNFVPHSTSARVSQAVRMQSAGSSGRPRPPL